MPRKHHSVRLSRDERRTVETMVRTGRNAAWTLERARIMLLADSASDHPARTDRQVADAMGTTTRRVARVRAAWCAERTACLQRKVRVAPATPRKLSDDQIMQVVAVARTDPPPGQTRWSLRLLAKRVVELEIVDHICVETVRQGLKRGGVTAA